MTIDEAIYAYIKTESGITDLIGTGDNCRAYPVAAPEAVTRPYLVWQTVGGLIPHNMGTDSSIEMQRVQFRAWDDDHAGADALIIAVDSSFRDYSGTMGGGGGVVVQRVFKESPFMPSKSPEAAPQGLNSSMVDYFFWIGS